MWQLRALAFLSLFLLPSGPLLPALAQTPEPAGPGGEAPPAATMAVAQKLLQERFETLEPGLEWMASGGNGLPRITVIRVDPARFRFTLVAQAEADGETAAAIGARAGAVLAVNGGFFGERETGRQLYPVGLLRIGGKAMSANWSRAGGYLLVAEDGLSIAASRPEPPQRPADVLQSKPLIVAPGGAWAMNTNQRVPRPRTLVCALSGGRTLLLVVSGTGLSLYEAGWLLRGRQHGGVFDCDAALALDGGGSTQLWVQGHGELDIEGETRVHNALVLMRR